MSSSTGRPASLMVPCWTVHVSAERCVAFAPGRVNLIGEHTDYKDGLSLPFAIQLGVTVTATVGSGEELTARALTHGEEYRLPLAGGEAERTGDWRDFVRGTMAELRAAGYAV